MTAEEERAEAIKAFHDLERAESEAFGLAYKLGSMRSDAAYRCRQLGVKL